jgi:hypothetical protein
MSVPHVAGWLLVVGALAFFIGAGNPYLFRAWSAPRATYLEIVARRPGAWRFTNLLFIAGTAMTAAGLVVLPALLEDGWPRGLAGAGATVFLIAAVLWIVSLEHRLAVEPASARQFVETGTVDPSVGALDRLSGGLFAAFIVIGFAGLATIGIAATGGGPIPATLGWGAAGLSGLLVAAFIAFGDMPPFTIYIVSIAFGIALLTGS